jgi:cephalosporin hydroxylase
MQESEIPYELLMEIQDGTLAYTYRGVPTLKSPFDLALYSLLLDSLRPRTLIEVGAHAGGSAMWFADQARARDLDMRVVSVDLTPPAIDHPNVSFVSGDARALDLPVDSFARPLLVVEDSDHHRSTVSAVLAYFDRWLASGDWIVVEDGIVGDMRIAEHFDGGPARAVREFLAQNAGRYVVDRTFCDYYGRNVTWNVDGWLRRV